MSYTKQKTRKLYYLLRRDLEIAPFSSYLDHEISIPTLSEAKKRFNENVHYGIMRVGIDIMYNKRVLKRINNELKSIALEFKKVLLK